MISIKEKININYYFIPFIAFLFYLAWALHLPMGQAPDEYMRIQIPFWIYEHGKLPIGNETELINSIWGTSYGFSPYLPSIISVFFMKVVSLYRSSPRALMFACRLTSVFSGTLTSVMCVLISHQLFKTTISKCLFISLICFIPQFVFISSYFNNDSFSVLCSAIIFYSWIRGQKTNWDYKSCIILGLGIGLISITYYFAYGWILSSILLFIISIHGERNHKEILKKILVIITIAFIVAGWYFIRNLIIYNGDLLGRKVSSNCAELFAQDAFKPSMKDTLRRQGLPLFSVLTINSYYWVIVTFKSFFAGFGYMSVFAPPFIYWLSFCLFLFLLLFLGIFFFKKRQTPFGERIIVPMLLCIIIPFILSMYFSWSWDYQPQGRYIISGIIPLMVLLTTGIDNLLTDRLGNKIYKLSAYIALLIWIFLFFYCFINMSYGKCWGL